jgi:hypothetical protein
MTVGSTDERRTGPLGALTATPARQAALAAVALVASVVGFAVARVAFGELRRGVRLACATALFWFRAATLRLYRRCPDCRRMIRAEARVCSHCGYRRATRRPRG